MTDHTAGSVRFRGGARIKASIHDLAGELIQALRERPAALESPPVARLLGILSAELGLHVSQPNNRYSAAKSMVHLVNLQEHPDMSPGFEQLQGARCVDVGCGGLNPVGGLFALLLAGAQSGVGVDLDELESLELAVRALYTVLCAAVTRTSRPHLPGTIADILDRIDGFDVEKLAAGDVTGVDRSRLDFVQQPLAAAGIEPGSVDILVSNSLLEHIPEPDALIADMAEVTRPGALCVHNIDGVDHRCYADKELFQLQFLREAAEQQMAFGCNRIAPLAFRDYFERNGFEVRGVREGARLALSDADIASFAPRFRDVERDRREVLRARFYLRRR